MTAVDELEMWRARAVWAETSLIIIEREILEVERQRLGGRRGALDVLWRLRARYPNTMRRLSAHRDREQDRRIGFQRRTRAQMHQLLDRGRA